MIIEEVDADDEAAFHEWFEPVHASEQFAWPEEPGWADLSPIISADAPHADIDYDEEDWNLRRLRNWEKNVEEMDRDLLVAGAVKMASGEHVAFTELGLPRSEPEVAYQFDTVVSAEHRGHRLGTLIKIANLRALVGRSPATRRVLTFNAAENEPMVRVNEAIGFELVGIEMSWQKELRAIG